MMRKLMISLSALVLVAFSARAQTPAPQHGLKAGYIALVCVSACNFDPLIRGIGVQN